MLWQTWRQVQTPVLPKKKKKKKEREKELQKRSQITKTD
jgi:hypothetical protein